MKTTYTLLLSLLLCLLFNSHSQAQHYQSIFGKQFTYWVFRWDNFPGEFQDTIFVQKDTLVNNINYKKIVFTSYSPNSDAGLLREDTIAGKVWYKSLQFYSPGPQNPNDTIEYLAFDFSLNKGDIFDVSNINIGYPGSYPSPWNIVDSVYYLNGRKYIQFAGPTSPAEPITLVEGIGGNNGIIWKHYLSYFQDQYLLCSYKDGVRTDYINKRYNGNCFINSQVGLEEEIRSTKVELYPNPFQDYFYLKASESQQIKQVIITNAVGQEVKRLHHPDLQQPLYTGNLSPGVYFVKVILYDNSVSHNKILKIN